MNINKFDIFFSYSRRDKNNIQWYINALKNNGHNVFIDKKMRPSIDFRPEIFTMISECKYLFVLWSKNSIESEWVFKEVREAIKKNKIIIPAIIHNVRPPEEFSHINAVDLSTWEGNTSHSEWKKIIELLGAKRRNYDIVNKSKLLFNDLKCVSENQINNDIFTIKVNNIESFNKYINYYVKKKYEIVKIDDGVAIFEKKKKLNLVIAIISVIFIIPAIIYHEIYKNIPEVDKVRIVLICNEIH